MFTQPMTKVTGPVKAAGGIEGTGATLVVEHTADNNLVDLPLQERRREDAGGRRGLRAERQEVPRRRDHRAERRSREARADAARPRPVGLGASPPRRRCKTHDLDIPRIGYVHSWTRTQDEGWVRAALDTYGVPYTYFADQKLKDETTCARSTT